MLYSKNGSIPKAETDGTSGWIEVPNPPVAPAGKEVVWWYPPGWVVRDTQPGPNWSWSQSEERWVEYAVQTTDESGTVVTTPEIDLGAPSAQPV
jgi:hypothetical protein